MSLRQQVYERKRSDILKQYRDGKIKSIEALAMLKKISEEARYIRPEPKPTELNFKKEGNDIG